MVTSQEKQQQYRRRWISVQNFLRNNTGYTIHGVARAGSTVEGGWTLRSDLDLQFSIVGNPSKQSIYPFLKEKLEKGFPNATVRIGSSYNVINMTLGELDFDLVLLSTHDFDTQVHESKIKRIN